MGLYGLGVVAGSWPCRRGGGEPKEKGPLAEGGSVRVLRPPSVCLRYRIGDSSDS